MKKTLYMLVAVIAAFVSSCSNDDIPVKNATTFKINPETVIDAFADIEWSPGELSSFSSGSQLRCRVLIYNKENNLVAEDSIFSPDYTHVLTSNLLLEDGEYTAVFSSDVVEKDPFFEYWHLLGREKLQTTTFKDAGYIGRHAKMLGLTVKHLNVKGSGEIRVDLEPAGAFALVMYDEWNRYTNVKYYKLSSNKTCDELTLNDKGDPTYSVESADWLAWRLTRRTYDSKYSGGYEYVFLFPMKNVTLQFAAELDNDETYNFEGASGILNIEAGGAYFFLYDVTANVATWLDFTKKTRSTGSRWPSVTDTMKSNIYGGEGHSLRVKDYIQASNPLEIK